MKSRFVACAAVLILSACNFGSNGNAAPSQATPVPIVLAATGTPAPQLTPPPQATAVPPTALPLVVQQVTCIVNASWPIYVVRAGDTLGTLAQRTSTTVTLLAQANCLANANSISVGQPLRLPQLPVNTLAPVNSPIPNSNQACIPLGNWPQYTAVKGDTLEFLAMFGQTTVVNLLIGNCWASADSFYAGVRMRVPAIPGRDGNANDVCPMVQPTGVGGMRMSPADYISPSCLHVRPGTTVTITWFDAPANMRDVTFYFVAVPDPIHQFSGNPDVIGISANPAGDPTITFVVYNTSVSGVLYAIGVPATGKAITSSAIGVSTW